MRYMAAIHLKYLARRGAMKKKIREMNPADAFSGTFVVGTFGAKQT